MDDENLKFLFSIEENPLKSGKVNFEKLNFLLDNLRIYVKYLLFDLESTRRENQYLRKIIEDNELNF